MRVQHHRSLESLQGETEARQIKHRIPKLRFQEQTS